MDELRLVVMSPWEEEEYWARDENWPGGRNALGTRILINGRDFMDIFAEVEEAKLGMHYDYGHSDCSGDVLAMNWLFPVCCAVCGDEGCCGFDGHMKVEDDGTVVWYGFATRGIEDYGLEFRFEGKAYWGELKRHEKEMRRRKSM